MHLPSKLKVFKKKRNLISIWNYFRLIYFLLLINEETHTLSYYQITYFLFLGTFTKLRKATISFVMSVILCVRSHETNRLHLEGL